MTTDGGAALGQPPCLVTLPASWQAEMQRGLLWHAVTDHHPSDAPTSDGSGVLLEEDSGGLAHIVIAGAGHRTVTRVGDVPNPSGQGQISFNTMSKRYAAFVYSPVNGDQSASVWQMWLWDRRSGTLSEVAHNPTESKGQPLHGGWVTPVLSGDGLYWIQATADTTGWRGSELIRYSLTTHTAHMIYRGLLTAFVPYQTGTLLTAITPGAPAPTPTTQANGPPLTTLMLDPATGATTPGPPGMTAGTDAPNTVIADGDLVLWSTDQQVRAWRPSWGRSITLIPDAGAWPVGTKLGLSGPTYVRLYKQFLIWNPGSNFVYDLRTNSFARLQTNPGSDDLSGSIASLQQYASSAPPDPSATSFSFDQVLLDLRTMPDLPGCAAR